MTRQLARFRQPGNALHQYVRVLHEALHGFAGLRLLAIMQPCCPLLTCTCVITTHLVTPHACRPLRWRMMLSHPVSSSQMTWTSHLVRQHVLRAYAALPVSSDGAIMLTGLLTATGTPACCHHEMVACVDQLIMTMACRGTAAPGRSHRHQCVGRKAVPSGADVCRLPYPQA